MNEATSSPVSFETRGAVRYLQAVRQHWLLTLLVTSAFSVFRIYSTSAWLERHSQYVFRRDADWGVKLDRMLALLEKSSRQGGQPR